MRKALLASALITSTMFALPVSAQDVDISGRLTDSANLPKQGSGYLPWPIRNHDRRRYRHHRRCANRR